MKTPNIAPVFVIILVDGRYLQQLQTEVDEEFVAVHEFWNASLYTEEFLPSLQAGEELYLEDEEKTVVIEDIYEVSVSLRPKGRK